MPHPPTAPFSVHNPTFLLMDDKSPEKGGEAFDGESDGDRREFKSEGEYLCDVDNVGAENTRQKIKAELDRSARLNRADKENKRRY